MERIIILFFMTLPALHTAFSQQFSKDVWNDGLTYRFDEGGKKFIRLTVAGQFWARYIQNNPGTLVYDEAKPHQADLSLRRVRMQLMIQPHERWFMYSQFGINNFNHISARKPSFFLHDFTVEYNAVKDALFIGGGLHAWAASSRYGAPAVASILGVDAPLYQQALNDQTDQFVRELGVYAKGRINRFNYRISLNKPFSFSKSESFNPNQPISDHAQFTPRDPSMEVSSYLEWQFMDKESDKIPYKAGTYLGKKKMLNLGAGVRYRPKASWYKTHTGDTAFAALWMAMVDVFGEMPFRKGGNTILSFYGAYSFYDFGPGYVRQVGVDNAATGTSYPSSPYRGFGDAYPMVGTGNSVYVQAGVISPGFGASKFRLMPYSSVFGADYRVYKHPVWVYEAGLNWYIKGDNLKITLGWQNRPFYQTTASIPLRMNMAVFQLQLFI